MITIAGAEPQAVVGRDDQLAPFELLLARIDRGRTEQLMIITGLWGVGKTVLLGQFRSKALERAWIVVELAVSKHDETEFRREISSRLRTALLELSPKARWSDGLKHAAAVLKSFTVSVGPGPGRADATGPHDRLFDTRRLWAFNAIGNSAGTDAYHRARLAGERHEAALR